MRDKGDSSGKKKRLLWPIEVTVNKQEQDPQAGEAEHIPAAALHTALLLLGNILPFPELTPKRFGYTEMLLTTVPGQIHSK